MITVEWHDSRRDILMLCYPANWDASAMHQAYDTTFRKLAEVDHPVISIVDMRQTQGIPKDSMMVAMQRERQAPPHSIGAILVTDRSIIRLVVQLLDRMPLLSDHFSSAPTIDEALRIARQRLDAAAV